VYVYTSLLPHVCWQGGVRYGSIRRRGAVYADAAERRGVAQCVIGVDRLDDAHKPSVISQDATNGTVASGDPG